MDRYQLKVFIGAYIVHILLTVVIPVLLTVMNVTPGFVGWPGKGDYYLFTDVFAHDFLSNPATLYQARETGFMWLPAYLLLYLLFYFINNVYIYMIVQIALFAPCLYYFGNILAKKSMPKMAYALLLVFFAGMWAYTYNYRVANDKIFVLFFFLLALWAMETKKHPVIIAIGLTMVVSRFVYFAPILLYWIFQEFHWKKVLWTVVVFVALNCVYLFYPFLIIDFLNYNLSLASNPTFVSVQSFNLPWGLFTYLRGTYFVGHGLLIFVLGMGILLGSSIWLFLRKYPFERFCTYYCLLVLMFFPINEWQHPSFLLPVIMLFYAQTYPLRTRDEQNKQTSKILMEWIPLACFFFIAFPIPSELADFIGAIFGLPTVLSPFRIVLFIVLFFILTLKKGLLSSVEPKTTPQASPTSS